MKQLTYVAPQDRKPMSQARASRIFLRENGKCYLCSNQIRPGEGWDVEHPEALSLGGKDTDENARIAHVRCHKDKSRDDAGAKAKRDRIITEGYAGKRKSNPMPGSKASGIRKRMNGRVEKWT